MKTGKWFWFSLCLGSFPGHIWHRFNVHINLIKSVKEIQGTAVKRMWSIGAEISITLKFANCWWIVKWIKL